MKNQFLTLLKQSPQLVASLDGDDLPFLLEQAKLDRADVVEIRLDLWGNFFREDMLEKMTRFKEKIGIPMIVSFRGGHPFPPWWQPVHWRALSQATMIDVEWNPKYPWREILTHVKKQGFVLMISHHDYQRTPSARDLVRLGKIAYSKKADVVKFATRLKNEADLRTLFEVNAAFMQKRLITVMGMGPWGALSRLTAPLYRACLVYGFIGNPTAIGQLPFKELQERIRALYPSYDAAFQQRPLRLGPQP